MVDGVRLFADYKAALVLSYEEEISGAAYFARLADFYSGRPRHALMLLADMERCTASAIRPLLDRHRLVAADPADLRAAGRAEADTRNGTAWRMLVGEMANQYPAFVEEFEQIERLAPASDKAVIGVLKDHEIAAVEFARKETRGEPNSLAPVEAFLAGHDNASSDHA